MARFGGQDGLRLRSVEQACPSLVLWVCCFGRDRLCAVFLFWRMPWLRFFGQGGACPSHVVGLLFREGPALSGLHL